MRLIQCALAFQVESHFQDRLNLFFREIQVADEIPTM